jgi:uncharacterized membrane protein
MAGAKKLNLDPAILALLGVIPAVGLFIASTLTWAHWLGADLPCGDSTGCEQVAASGAAFFFGIPVALFGAVAFLALGLLSLVSTFERLERLARNLGYAISALGSFLSFGLTMYSIEVVHTTCSWCVASLLAFCATFLGYAVVSYSEIHWNCSPARASVRAVVGTSLLVSLTAVGVRSEFLSLQTPQFNPARLASANLLQLVPTTSPTLGDKRAGLILVFFGDFECASCKRALPILAKTVDENPGTELVYRYYPLKTHDYAFRAAVSAERSKSTVGFWSFVWKLYADPEPLTPEYLHSVENWAGLQSIDSPNDPRLATYVKKVGDDLHFGRVIGLGTTPSIVMLHGSSRTVVSFQVALARVRTYRWDRR